MILSALGLNHAFMVLFPGTHVSRTSQWVTHHENDLTPFSLNFGVPTEPEASELPKSLVLYGGARRPRRHTRTTRQSGSDTKVSHPDPSSTTSRARLRRSTILSALGFDHVLTVLFLGTHVSRTFQWVTYPRNALAPFSLNFGVPTEPEANELPKGLMLYGGLTIKT
ncbi:unnamed protein product [Malus baccata var. baccata]